MLDLDNVRGRAQWLKDNPGSLAPNGTYDPITTAILAAECIEDTADEVERLRAHIKAHEEWEAQMRPALDALIESLPYDCAGPVPPGCGGTCPLCRVQILLT